MIPASFDYERPASVDAALALLTQHGDDAKVLAGGHSLLPLMKLRFANPEVLIDISGLRELSYVRLDGDDVVIGAGTRHHELEHDKTAQEHVPLLSHVASRVGDPQVRHRGTLGGTIAHADPASDLPTAVLALGGSILVRSQRGERAIAMIELYQGFLQTSLESDELLVEVRVPRIVHGWGYEKFTRRENDWPIVSAAAVDGRVALANMASTVLRATAVEESLAGGASVADAAEQAGEGTEPGSDMHADREYRTHLARLLTRRALERAA